MASLSSHHAIRPGLEAAVRTQRRSPLIECLQCRDTGILAVRSSFDAVDILRFERTAFVQQYFLQAERLVNRVIQQSGDLVACF